MSTAAAAEGGSRRLCVLVNPTAGGGRAARALPAVEGALRGRGAHVRVARTESAAHGAELAAQAVSGGEELVTLGGDGMVRLAAHAARGSDAIVSVLPGGRGNDFARSLGLPLDPVAACRVALEGRVRTVDVGVLHALEGDLRDEAGGARDDAGAGTGGETFVGIASIGLESEVTRIANNAPSFMGGSVYLLATLAGLARWRPASFALTLDEVPESFTGYMAAVANSGRFGGGMRLAPDASLDDGLFDVVELGAVSRLRFLANTPKVFRGTHVGEDSVSVLRAREVRLDAERPFDVYADGDAIGRTPAVARVHPGALRVRVPAVA
ncbi:MAG: diacylglycerol kinase family lipid kinase [Acidobacteriota bacterium]|nr:diacylglycerol kinase family lipid kinase [Acidobacteriota bacterium]